MTGTLLEQLRHIRDHGPKYRLVGICGNVANADAFGDVLPDLFEMWSEFSGSYAYPVPSPDPTRPASKAFREAQDFGMLWDHGTEYGEARWRLLEFCIAELEKTK